jgi:hypothetical protein
MSYVQPTVPAAQPHPLSGVLTGTPWWVWLGGGLVAWQLVKRRKKIVRHARIAHAKVKIGAEIRRRRRKYQRLYS